MWTIRTTARLLKKTFPLPILPRNQTQLLKGAVVVVAILLVALGARAWFVDRAPRVAQPQVRFAVIGDFGGATVGYAKSEQAVAELVHSWEPEVVVTVGDNNYELGGADTIEANIGQFYGDYIREQRFFPTLGNHDWKTAGAKPYLDYFTLPGNERYYDVVRGPVHFFFLDSDEHEPDGITHDSIQARWLQEKVAASTAPWQIALMHHPPYVSGSHTSTVALQWPYEAWGVDAVLAGHAHVYERLEVGNIPYIVNGLGGKNIHATGKPLPESQLQYNKDYGAMLVEADATAVTFTFINRQGQTIDTHTVTRIQ